MIPMILSPVFHVVASGTPDPGTLANILAAATELATWIFTILTSVVTFVTGNPVVLVLFLMMLISFAVGIFFRIWRSTGV